MKGFNGEDPDFVNEIGVKWWKQEINWGSSVNLKRRLERLNVSWWLTKQPDGTMKYVAIRDGEIIKTDNTLDGICCYLDVMPMALEK